MADRRYILAGSLIDGSGGKLLRHVVLQVEKGIIRALGSGAELAGVDRAVIDDFSHCTILPGLVDCNVSLASSPALLVTAESDSGQGASHVAQHLGYCHDHGVLGLAASDDIGELTTVAQATIVTIRTRADFARISYSADIGSENSPPVRPDYEELGSLLQRRGEKKAVVLANGPHQVAEALAAGCDAIEQGYGMGEANLRLMAERGVLWIPAVLRARNGLDGAASGGSVCCRFSHRYVGPGKALPGVESFWKKMLAAQLDQLRLARELGVITATGTGAGSVGILHGESMVEEMKLFLKAGYTLEETIRCASANGAGFFGINDKLGTLAVGQPATFLITRGTPKQLPRKLSYLEGIYLNGRPSSYYRKNPVRVA